MRQWRETWGGWEAGPSFQAVLGIRSFFLYSGSEFSGSFGSGSGSYPRYRTKKTNRKKGLKCVEKEVCRPGLLQIIVKEACSECL